MIDGLTAGAAVPATMWSLAARPRALRRTDLAHWMLSTPAPHSPVRPAELPPVDLYAEACAPEGALVVDGLPLGRLEALAPR